MRSLKQERNFNSFVRFNIDYSSILIYTDPFANKINNSEHKIHDLNIIVMST